MVSKNVPFGVSDEAMSEIFAQWLFWHFNFNALPESTKKAFIFGLTTAVDWIEKPESGEKH